MAASTEVPDIQLPLSGEILEVASADIADRFSRRRVAPTPSGG
jgi:hypothetical protein